MALSKEEQRRKYITGDYKSLKDFAEREGVNYNYLRKYSSDWVRERNKYRANLGAKILEKTAEKAVSQEVSLNTRVLNISERLLKAFDELDAQTVAEIAREGRLGGLTKALLDLQKVHRTAEGLDIKKEESGEDGVKIVVERKVIDLSKNKRGGNNAD